MFSKLIRGILGLIGVIKKDVAFKASEFSDFFKGLMPGSIVLVRKRNSDGFSAGIMASTNSAWSHTMHYSGKSGGIKDMLHEIVEAIAEGICIESLDKYNSADFQMAAFTFDINPREYETLKARIYSHVGEPYDFQGIAHQVFPMVPDNPNRVYCSALSALSWMRPELIRQIIKKGIDPNDATPGDIYNACFSNLSVKISKFNW
jgi:hypothetical protein